jgi:putative serine protease PepD
MDMTHEPAPGRGSGSGRLWTDPREEEEHTPWLAPRTAIEPTEPLRDPDPGPPEEPRRALWPTIALATIVAAVLFGAGVLGANLLFSDDDALAPAALPVSPGAAPADSRSKTVRSIYARTSPSVVSVRAREGSGISGGTGFVIDRRGTIVTNTHVVAGASRVEVRLDDHGDSIQAQVLGSDASSDLAVLRVSGSAASRLRPLVLADSNAVQVGDLAVAIGYPLGLDRTATAGIVSGVGRAITAPNGFRIDKVIQTDAPINPGNSGGPLLDSAGRVIGVNSQIATANGASGSIGIGFAVPSNTVREVVPRLEQGRSIKRAYLGVSMLASTVSSGALVADVKGGSPAESSGVHVGDIIVQLDGKRVTEPEDITTAIDRREPGDEVDVEVQRAGGRKTVRVTLGTRPENTTTP